MTLKINVTLSYPLEKNYLLCKTSQKENTKKYIWSYSMQNITKRVPRNSSDLIQYKTSQKECE